MPTAIEADAPAAPALGRIASSLDLTNVRLKLADPDEGKGYGSAHLDVMEAEYRKFLALKLTYPDGDIVPCGLVDEMWHQHILDTIAYRDDCDAIFGCFLDHFPYFGLRGEADTQALHNAYDDTLRRYRQNFGEPPAETWVSRDAAKKCRTGCKPMKCR
jgi:hypothetical protein